VAVVSGSRVGDRGARVGALAGCGGVGRMQEAALVRAWGGSRVGGDAALPHRKKERRWAVGCVKRKIGAPFSFQKKIIFYSKRACLDTCTKY